MCCDEPARYMSITASHKAPSRYFATGVARSLVSRGRALTRTISNVSISLHMLPGRAVGVVKKCSKNARQIVTLRRTGSEVGKMRETCSSEQFRSNGRAPAAKLGHVWPICSPSLARIGPMLSDLDPHWPPLGQTWPKFASGARPLLQEYSHQHFSTMARSAESNLASIFGARCRDACSARRGSSFFCMCCTCVRGST